MFATEFVECLQVAGTWVTREERPILPLQQGEQFSGEEASALQWIAPGAEIRLFPGLCVALSRPALATATRGIYFGDPTPLPTLPLAPAPLAASLGRIRGSVICSLCSGPWPLSPSRSASPPGTPILSSQAGAPQEKAVEPGHPPCVPACLSAPPSPQRAAYTGRAAVPAPPAAPPVLL